MVKELTKEILFMTMVIVVVSVLSFFILFFLPGSSQEIKVGLESSPRVSKDVHNGVFDIVVQYSSWVKQVFRGDWGMSEYSDISVIDLIKKKWGYSVFLAILSVSITIFISVLWCGMEEMVLWTHASRLKTLVSTTLRVIERILLSFIPLTLALTILSVVSLFQISTFDTLLGTIGLPLLCLVLIQIPLYIRSLKVSIHKTKNSGFVEFAYAMGYSRIWVLWREILPHALLFTLTLSLVQISYLVGGTIIVENIFSVSGLGTQFLHSVMSRDRMVVQGIVVLATIVIACVQVIFTSIKYVVYRKEQ